MAWSSPHTVLALARALARALTLTLALTLALALASASAETLYAGGDFSRLGAVHAYAAAKWDGLAWSPAEAALSSPTAVPNAGGWQVETGGLDGGDGIVNAMAMYNGDLVFAGSFTVAGKSQSRAGVPAGSIVGLSSATSAWFSLGDGLATGTATTTANVVALAVFAGDLIACGTFAKAGDSKATSVAAWDG